MRRTMINLKILGLVLIFIVQEATGQFSFPDTSNVCYTPNNIQGTCVDFQSCPSLVRLIQQKPLPDSTRRFLQLSQCGYSTRNLPKVCCQSSEMLGTSSMPSTDLSRDDLQPPDVTSHANLYLLDHNNCGPINQDRIAGGNRTRVNEFPWMAILIYRVGNNPKPEFRCAGSVINKRHILTAAHCVTKLNSNLRLIGVRIGEHNLESERDCDFAGTFEEVCADGVQDFSIEKIISHPKYSTVSYETKLHNDIALIKLTSDIDFTPANAKPICLPIGSASRITSKKLQVTGWGLDENRMPSPTLLKVAVPRIPQEECVERFKDQLRIWQKQLCMGGEKGKDSCSGDSGGPLQGPAVYEGNSRYVQYGIVSFGSWPCGIQYPGVYTRVDYYLDWILQNLTD